MAAVGCGSTRPRRKNRPPYRARRPGEQDWAALQRRIDAVLCFAARAPNVLWLSLARSPRSLHIQGGPGQCGVRDRRRLVPAAALRGRIRQHRRRRGAHQVSPLTPAPSRAPCPQRTSTSRPPPARACTRPPRPVPRPVPSPPRTASSKHANIPAPSGQTALSRLVEPH